MSLENIAVDAPSVTYSNTDLGLILLIVSVAIIVIAFMYSGSDLEPTRRGVPRRHKVRQSWKIKKRIAEVFRAMVFRAPTNYSPEASLFAVRMAGGLVVIRYEGKRLGTGLRNEKGMVYTIMQNRFWYLNVVKDIVKDMLKLDSPAGKIVEYYIKWNGTSYALGYVTCQTLDTTTKAK